MKILSLFIIYGAIILASSPQANAQQYKHVDDGFSIGASVNYGGIYFEKDASFLNDIWSNSVGFQSQVMYGMNLSSVFSVKVGAELFVHRYQMDDIRSVETNDVGEPTGNEKVSFMNGSVGTTYLSLPVNLIIRPLRNKAFYAVVGPDVSFKIAHKNGMLKMRSIPNSDYWFDNDVKYEVPEQSRDTMFFANVGLGYSFAPFSVPLNVELRAKHSMTTFMDDESFADIWVRNVSFSVAYRF
ncbi:MAG: outer membrane beta-barrel protein [Balneolales bacterium]|nr:outer membrane beta-barrel protein [Balneolales bacterium]